MVPEVRNILNKASYLYSNFKDEYQRCYDRSSQVIIFGSYAYGCETNDSDIDIFFVGHEKRKAHRGLDFIWLHPRKLNSKIWLGSELATHIAEYGIWVKGDDRWRKHVFFSEAAIKRKKEKIYRRLVYILLRETAVDYSLTKNLLESVLLNSYRLKMLYKGIPIPPVAVSAKLIYEESTNLFIEMSQKKYLGSVGAALFKEIIQNNDLDVVYEELKKDLYVRYNH